MQVSALQKARYEYNPKLPLILREDISSIRPVLGAKTQSAQDQEALGKLFPNTYGLPKVAFEKGSNPAFGKKLNVGVILSGGQAPGGHNVICGLYDALKKSNKESQLYGFVGGPSGILEDKYMILNDDIINAYRNTGGFDIIGSGRTKLETKEQFAVCSEVCKKHNINAIVIIGGDDSNTNAAVLAEYFAAKGEDICVVGCPKTIDGDLKNESIETSFGFDTACKTYSELIGNIERDANSARKYWHFIRLMGRSASHITLECAIQTQPNICLVGEEVEAKNLSVEDITNYIANIVAKRAENGNNFGVCLVPEGLIEFIPSIKSLISEINDLLAKVEKEFNAIETISEKISYVASLLSDSSKKVFNTLPETIKGQLLADRDPHGNVQVSKIETEKLLIETVDAKLKEMKSNGKYVGKFSSLSHFFGYEGRCAFPSNFDADYCYSLGYNAFMLLSAKLTGYLSSVTNLSKPADQWQAGGIPITMMMNLEQRHGEKKPVIKKALVELNGGPFTYFEKHRDVWAVETAFTFPGAIQYFGPSEVCDQTTKTLALEHQN
ncbi:MAG: diphosphate--fructose-6-phosphate 1-phosphotransferase [Sphaerochaetaceae bacterium]|nr:diphosphate--fructose-6-phosphate 1-phosphotransferase [Sphaerochaetaceae bacterium]